LKALIIGAVYAEKAYNMQEKRIPANPFNTGQNYRWFKQ